MLLSIKENDEITAREIATEIGITERAVRKIIAELECEKYLTKIKIGRKVKYTFKKDMPLRRQRQKDIAVGKLLNVLVRK